MRGRATPPTASSHWRNGVRSERGEWISGQATTGADGTVTFVDLVPDTYTLTGGVPGEFAGQVVQCAADAGSVPSSPAQRNPPAQPWPSTMAMPLPAAGT